MSTKVREANVENGFLTNPPNGLFIVIDLTNEESYQWAQKYIENEIQKESKETRFYVIGNKCLSKDRCIRKTNIIKYIQQQSELKCKYYEVDVMNDYGINEMFMYVMKDCTTYYLQYEEMNKKKLEEMFKDATSDDVGDCVIC